MVNSAGQLGPSSHMMILMMCVLTMIYKPAYRFRYQELRDEAGLYFFFASSWKPHVPSTPSPLLYHSSPWAAHFMYISRISITWKQLSLW